MNAAPIVLLLGESLLMESVARGLANRRLMNVIRMDPAVIAMKDCLKCLEPELVIFELGDPFSDRLVALLNERPEVQLAGLDVANCHLILLTGQQYVTPTMQELLQVVQRHTQKQASTMKGGEKVRKSAK